jgi:hypothetical protein
MRVEASPRNTIQRVVSKIIFPFVHFVETAFIGPTETNLAAEIIHPSTQVALENENDVLDSV